MASVLRSNQQRIELNQSSLDATADSFEPILHAVPPQVTPRGQIRTILGEITIPNPEDGTEHAQPTVPKDAVDVELKGLKAAFRSAIGIKKKKKPKKLKLPDASSSILDNHNLLESMAGGTAMQTPLYFNDYALLMDGRATELVLRSSGACGNTALTDRSVEYVAPPRVTRQRLSMQQESGQSEQALSYHGCGSRPGLHSGARTISSQLISNITDGQFEILRTLEIANHSLNLADGVRRELDELINMPEVKAYLQQQPPIQVNTAASERSVKMLGFIDDCKTPTDTLQISKEVTAEKSSNEKPVAKKIVGEIVIQELTVEEETVEKETVQGQASEMHKSHDSANDSDDDSFIQVITSRSPAKPVSRGNDFVDELDRLEDVIEALEEATSPNLKVASPQRKTAMLSGKKGFVRSEEDGSRHVSPTDAELAKLHAAQEAVASKANGYRSLREKSKDSQPRAARAELRKAKSTHFERSGSRESSFSRLTARTVSQVTQVISRSSSSAAVSKRPGLAATARGTRDLSRASSRATEIRRSVSNKRPTTASVAAKPQVKTTKPLKRPTFELPGEAISRKIKEQREARRAQREIEQAGSAVPKIRSTKTPTKPAFELPGEAISRRKREAHEARLKREAEEERKRREFRARPSRGSFVASGGVRGTAVSLARQSMIAGGNAAESPEGKPSRGLAAAKKGATRPQPSSADSNISSSGRIPAAVLPHRNLTPHISVVGTARPAPATKSTASTATGLQRSGTVRNASKNSITSMTGLPLHRSKSFRQVSSSALKGKEIYQKYDRAVADMQKEKKEKEEAAKRSRELAAEKGRQASREWAEKQRAKLRGKDVGIGPGFGAGGQMGLKS